MERTIMSVCCRSVCTDAKYLRLNASRSRIFFVQGFGLNTMLLEDLPCNSLGNLLNLNIYPNQIIFFSPLLYGISSLFNFIKCFLWCFLPKLNGWSVGTRACHTLGRMLGTQEKERSSRESWWKTLPFCSCAAWKGCPESFPAGHVVLECGYNSSLLLPETERRT